jgi:hypothetical protein
MNSRPIIERFLDKITITDNSCWEWTGSLSNNGYGFIEQNYRTIRAHRFSYEYFNNTLIPSDKCIDHLCRNHKCVNPDHLEVVTIRENQMRGINPELARARGLSLTHCIHGHPYDLFNTYYNPEGYRRCKICRSENAKKCRQALKSKYESEVK